MDDKAKQRARSGRRPAHERLCVPAVRARRRREGKPPAAWVMVHYWQSRRVAAYKPEP